ATKKLTFVLTKSSFSLGSSSPSKAVSNLAISNISIHRTQQRQSHLPCNHFQSRSTSSREYPDATIHNSSLFQPTLNTILYGGGFVSNLVIQQHISSIKCLSH